MSDASNLTGTHPCLICDSNHPENAHTITLAVRVQALGLRPVHWECAAHFTWPATELAASLQPYNDGSAHVIIAPRFAGSIDRWLIAAEVPHLQDTLFRTLSNFHESCAARAASVVWLASLIKLYGG